MWHTLVQISIRTHIHVALIFIALSIFLTWHTYAILFFLFLNVQLFVRTRDRRESYKCNFT